MAVTACLRKKLKKSARSTSETNLSDSFSLEFGACRSLNRLPPVPLKGFNPYLGLQRLNLQTQSPLAEMHNFCGTTEAQRFGQRKERTNVPELHKPSLFGFLISSYTEFNFKSPPSTSTKQKENLI